MDLKLTDRSVIVTGASQGLGKAIATQFANEGAKVLISSRNEKILKQTAQEIKQQTGNEKVRYIVCDLTKQTHIANLVEYMMDWTNKVDVLINNSGGPPAGNFFDVDDEDWEYAFHLNLLSVVRMIREVVPIMKKQQRGHIVNLTSSSMKQSLDQLILSNTMRPGVLGLTKSLAQELGAYNILINAVGPGIIKTERITELNKARAKATGESISDIEQQTIAQIPMQRLGTPEEFAKTIVFLASSANSYITGQSLIIDGGQLKAL